MRIIKGAAAPQRKLTYEFHKLKVGDAVDVQSYAGCKEMFRRWRIQNNKPKLALVYSGPSPDTPGLHRFHLIQR